MKKLFFMFLCVFLSTQMFAQQRINVKTFMPANNLNEVDGLYDNGMTEAEFNAIIDEVVNYYAPIANQYGANFVVNRLWNDSTVNAQAYQQGNTWYVDMFGGLARRPEITRDGFQMVVCHETGHHFGGFPANGWAAYEGQADYFALHVCAKNLWANQPNQVPSIQPYAKKLCDQNVKGNLNLCYREMNASYSLASLLAALGNETASFQTPDKSKVSRTNPDHPRAQCRLDTYVAGNLCGTQWNDYVIPQTEQESANYLCTTGVGARPRCWFKPSF